MSQEFQQNLPADPRLARKGLFSWLRRSRRQTEYAHPWSAYSPDTYLAGDAPQGIVIATRVHTLFEAKLQLYAAASEPALPVVIEAAAPIVLTAACTTETSHAAVKTTDNSCAEQATAAVTTIAPAKPCEKQPLEPQLQPAAAAAKPEQPAVEAPAAPVVQQPEAPRASLALVPIQPAVTEKQEPFVLPEPRSDFHLSARLCSVRVLNRVSRTGSTNATPDLAEKVSKTRHGGRNRPVNQIVNAKRVRKIEPPAVLRNTRVSAEVISLNLALARIEHRNARARQAA